MKNEKIWVPVFGLIITLMLFAPWVIQGHNVRIYGQTPAWAATSSPYPSTSPTPFACSSPSDCVTDVESACEVTCKNNQCVSSGWHYCLNGSCILATLSCPEDIESSDGSASSGDSSGDSSSEGSSSSPTPTPSTSPTPTWYASPSPSPISTSSSDGGDDGGDDPPPPPPCPDNSACASICNFFDSGSMSLDGTDYTTKVDLITQVLSNPLDIEGFLDVAWDVFNQSDAQDACYQYWQEQSQLLQGFGPLDISFGDFELPDGEVKEPDWNSPSESIIISLPYRF